MRSSDDVVDAEVHCPGCRCPGDAIVDGQYRPFPPATLVRRCAQALYKARAYRGQPDWDDLPAAIKDSYLTDARTILEEYAR